jgi:hypothetical protein
MQEGTQFVMISQEPTLSQAPPIPIGSQTCKQHCCFLIVQTPNTKQQMSLNKNATSETFAMAQFTRTAPNPIRSSVRTQLLELGQVKCGFY